MSTESDIDADTANGINASRSGGGNHNPSETLAEKVSGEVQVGMRDVVEHRSRDEQEPGISGELGCSSSSVSAGDDGMEKRSECTDLERETESVNGRFGLGAETQNIDVETNGNEKKFPGGSGEVVMGNKEETVNENDSEGLIGKLLGDKKAEDGVCDTLELETVAPDRVNSGNDDPDVSPQCQDSCVLGSIVEDINHNGSGKEDTEVKNQEGEPVAISKPNVCNNENVSDDVGKPADAKPLSSESDLVWAKVRSHPWWPGKNFDASDASEKAKKYFKKGTFLVTYFGDHTFAWNEPSRIKPFQEHFSQMEKQSNLAEFHHAIDCVLEEVSRRIEFGLSCPCVSGEVYSKIRTQNIINPGIREESSVREGGDSISSATFFEPVKLVEYIKSVACTPSYSETDRLHFVSRRAQLLAFHRWKGYPNLPEFETLHGSVESARKIPPPGGNKDLSQVAVSVAEPNTIEHVSSKKRKIEENNDFGEKRRRDSEDRTARSKKEKTLSEYIADKRSSKNKGNRSDEKSGGEQISGKKRKVVSSETDKLAKRIEKSNLPIEDPTSQDSAKDDEKYNFSAGDTNKPQKPKPVFGIGASILRVASQMNSSPPTILKPCGGSTPKKTAKIKIKKIKLEDTKDSSKEQMQPENKKEAVDAVPDTPSNDNNSTDVQKEAGNLDSKKQALAENSPEDCSDHSSKEDCSEDVDASMPNALILNFSDLDSVPSVEKLNKIFSRYGPLRESETEVMKKSKKAKVVFKRGEDAETAFSSAGKYSIFGPSLLSYRLKHAVVKPFRDGIPNNKTKVDA